MGTRAADDLRGVWTGSDYYGRDRVANRDVTNQPDYSRARGACAYRGAVTESDASPRSRRQLMEI
jgi:hypothetical protein